MTSVISAGKEDHAVSKKYPYPLVKLEWIDAETDHGWESADEKNPTVPLVTTVGFLIKDTEELVSIASTVGDDRSHNSRINIPKGMVKTMTVLRKS